MCANSIFPPQKELQERDVQLLERRRVAERAVEDLGLLVSEASVNSHGITIFVTQNVNRTATFSLLVLRFHTKCAVCFSVYCRGLQSPDNREIQSNEGPD